MATSNNITGALSFAGMLMSVPIIGTGIWLATKQDNECVKFLQWPVIAIGVFVLLFSLAGFVGAFWRIPWLLIIHLIAMFIIIILLTVLVIFVFLVTEKGSGHSVPNRAYQEYQLSDYSAWLRHRVRGPFKWNRIRNCLSTSGLCSPLNQRFTFAQDFFNARLSPLESGCCKPPTLCGYTFVNPTYWISPINQAEDMDCLQWNNDQTQLCYGCNSCKAGLLASLKKEWRLADIILLVTLVALIFVYVMGCSAFRNAQAEDIFRRYKQGYT